MADPHAAIACAGDACADPACAERARHGPFTLPAIAPGKTAGAKRKREAGGPFARKHKNHKERADWVAKYRVLGAQATSDAGFEVNGDGIPLLRCAKCDELKERTTDYFTANNVRGNLDKWFISPFPSMRNSISHPCNACWSQLSLDRDRDFEGDGWLLSHVSNYSVTIEWAKKLYELPVRAERCWATGGTLPFQKGINAFALGINSTVIQTEGKYSGKKAHDAADIVPVYQFSNVRQTVAGPKGTKVVIIPSLREAFADMYRQVIASFKLQRAELVNLGKERVNNMKTSVDFGGITSAARQNDKKNCLYNNMSSSRVLDMVRAQHAICCTSGIIMTSFSASGGVRGPFDVHMDRINDLTNSSVPKGHVDTNVEFKCRLFNNVRSITRKDFLLLFLNQVLVPLTEDVRALAKKEYDAMPCSTRDAWNHSIAN